MTTDEKLAVIAEAILALAKSAAYTREYDGETMVGKGVELDRGIERKLEEIAADLNK
jgi:hypothetical protein